jgi:transposase
LAAPDAGGRSRRRVERCDEVTSNRAVRQLEERIRELERQLGRKTLEVEILKEALDKARPKNLRRQS